MEKSLLWFMLRWLLTGILLIIVNVSAIPGTSKEYETSAAKDIVAGGVTAADEALAVVRAEREWEMYEMEVRLRESLPVSDINRKLIEISSLDGTEQDLLELVYGEMEAYEAEGGRYIQGQINLSFDGLVLASVECGDEYQVFIALQERIYRLRSAHSYSRNDWNKMMQKALDEVFEEQKLRRDLTEDFFGENMAQEEECGSLLGLWYRGICCLFHPDWDQRLLSWQKRTDGISFCEAYYLNQGKESAERTFVLRRLEELGGTKSHSVLRRRLQDLYPELEACCIWSYEEREACLAEVWLTEEEKAGFYSNPAAWQRGISDFLYRSDGAESGGRN